MPPKFSTAQEIFIICEFSKSESGTVVRREFLRHFDIRGREKYRYTSKDFCRVYNRFLSNGVSHSKPGKRRGFSITYDQQFIFRVEAYFEEHPTHSIRQAALDIDASTFSVWKVLRQSLKFRAYKIHKVHKSNDSNYAERDTFCIWFLSKGAGFHRNVLFSDEKWWVLNSSPNSQNDRF